MAKEAIASARLKPETMREVALDTETTGLYADKGDRLVEIGCVELINHIPTGKVYHTFINPEREMSEGASKVTGITDDQLVGKPLFPQIADDFLEFIAEDPIVIHNAAFDLGFINMELKRMGRPTLAPGREIDTVVMARRKYPRAPASLDALCRRFDIDLSGRDTHGALIDAELLAAVYLELIGGRQPGLVLSANAEVETSEGAATAQTRTARQRPKPLPSPLTEEILAAHRAFVEKELGEDALWTAHLDWQAKGA